MAVTEHTETDLTLTCFACGEAHDPDVLQTLCASCGLPLRVGVELPAEGPLVDDSMDSMWRYHSVLPVPLDRAVTLGEGWTALKEVSPNLWVKDESTNPTGSFKDRGMSMAVSAARERGAKQIVAPSAGNAAVALSAYGQAAEVEVLVAMPDDTPNGIIEACRSYGADVHLVDGDISVAGKWLAANRSDAAFDVSTLKEPFRVEGKKTMGYELWEQFDGKLPDVVIYPTGGGTGLVGMWKAWDELEAMGRIGAERPRLFSVQSAGCAPIVAAYEAGADNITAWPNPKTTAWGLRVPSPIGGFLCLRAVRETEGGAVAVPEEALHEGTAEASDATGFDFCPEGGAAWVAAATLRESGVIGPAESVLVWNTGAGRNYR